MVKRPLAAWIPIAALAVTLVLFSHDLAMTASPHDTGNHTSGVRTVSVDKHADMTTPIDDATACAALSDFGAAGSGTHPLSPHDFLSVSPAAASMTDRALPPPTEQPHSPSLGQLRALLQVYLM